MSHLHYWQLERWYSSWRSLYCGTILRPVKSPPTHMNALNGRSLTLIGRNTPHADSGTLVYPESNANLSSDVLSSTRPTAANPANAQTGRGRLRRAGLRPIHFHQRLEPLEYLDGIPIVTLDLKQTHKPRVTLSESANPRSTEHPSIHPVITERYFKSFLSHVAPHLMHGCRLSRCSEAHS